MLTERELRQQQNMVRRIIETVGVEKFTAAVVEMIDSFPEERRAAVLEVPVTREVYDEYKRKNA